MKLISEVLLELKLGQYTKAFEDKKVTFLDLLKDSDDQVKSKCNEAGMKPGEPSLPLLVSPPTPPTGRPGSFAVCLETMLN